MLGHFSGKHDTGWWCKLTALDGCTPLVTRNYMVSLRPHPQLSNGDGEVNLTVTMAGSNCARMSLSAPWEHSVFLLALGNICSWEAIYLLLRKWTDEYVEGLLTQSNRHSAEHRAWALLLMALSLVYLLGQNDLWIRCQVMEQGQNKFWNASVTL